MPRKIPDVFIVIKLTNNKIYVQYTTHKIPQNNSHGSSYIVKFSHMKSELLLNLNMS